MKIWIDITNSPHVNFFRPFIENWTGKGYSVLITARPLANTLPLLELYGINYHVVGGHAGKSSFKKIIGFVTRVFQLIILIKKHKVDVGISQSSFYSPVAGRLSGVPVIYTNDNEYATGNALAFKFATINILPEALSAYSEMFKSKFIFYPGVKEAIYLCGLMKSPDLLSLQNEYAKLKIFLRLEPDTAQYHTANPEAFKACIDFLHTEYDLCILPRSESQYRYYSMEFPAINISRRSMTLEDILNEVDVFIGAGGSMTREFAVMGVPTVSIYRGDLLEVDRYLIEKGNLVHSTLNVSELENAISLARKLSFTPMEKEGITARELIETEIINLVNDSNP